MPWATNGFRQHYTRRGMGALYATTACSGSRIPPSWRSGKQPEVGVPVCDAPACQSAYAAWKEGEGRGMAEGWNVQDAAVRLLGQHLELMNEVLAVAADSGAAAAIEKLAGYLAETDATGEDFEEVYERWRDRPDCTVSPGVLIITEEPDA